MEEPNIFYIVGLEWDYILEQQQKNLVQQVSSKFDLQEKDTIDLKQYISQPINKNLCFGRVWGCGYGTQCGHYPKHGDYCPHHYKLSQSEKGLPLGRVDQPCPQKLPCKFLSKPEFCVVR